MNTSWDNSRETLKEFAKLLLCNKCKNKPTDAVRYINCGHFFCMQCIGNDSICTICKVPVQPVEISKDPFINSLVSDCNEIAEIIQEKYLWDKSTNERTTPTKRKTAPRINIPQKNINKRNAKGETHLHSMCLKNRQENVKLLLAAGANPNTKDNSGWTPLQEVTSFGYTSICQLLLECGASPNIPGVGSRTALHEAVINNRLKEAEILLDYSANPNVYDDCGKKPIDYCQPNSEMWNILQTKSKFCNVPQEIVDLNNTTLNQSLNTTQSGLSVIYGSNLGKKNKKYLEQQALKGKIKIVSTLRSSMITHVIVETNEENIAQLSYDVMIALLKGYWLLNTEWIQFNMDFNEVLNGDLAIFEVSGAPVKDIPKKARINAQNQNPGLFNGCHFYFAMQSNTRCRINDDTELTKDALIGLIQSGGGTVLTREPNAEDVSRGRQIVPFHVASEPKHPLYKCTHYIIYIPGKDKPRMKYNMPHIKALPMIWLIECIEKFSLVDPSQIMGL